MIIHNVEEGRYTEDSETLEELKRIKEEEDTMEKHGKIVQIVTDDYLSWNKLKDFLLLNPQEFETQLRINENALRNNPKSYQAWYHRRFMMGSFPEQRVKHLDREDFLTALLLDSDPRNFHCWNYRMSVLGSDKSGVRDLFNYSYLSHHSNFDPIPIIYTDPLDATGWECFYVHRERKRLEKGVYIRKYRNDVEIRFRDLFHGEMVFKSEATERTIFRDVNTKILVVENIHGSLAKCEVVANQHKMKFEVNMEDISFVEEILESEPECYNALLVLLERVEGKTERNRIINKLIELDPIRERYYTFFTNEFYSVHLPSEVAFDNVSKHC